MKLLPKRTAFENVPLLWKSVAIKKKKLIKDVPKILDLVGLLHKKDSFPHEMSGGENKDGHCACFITSSCSLAGQTSPQEI